MEKEAHELAKFIIQDSIDVMDRTERQMNEIKLKEKRTMKRSFLIAAGLFAVVVILILYYL